MTVVTMMGNGDMDDDGGYADVCDEDDYDEDAGGVLAVREPMVDTSR